MFSHKLEDDAPFKTYLFWFLLSFLAGNINVGGLMACHRFVSHVTGFATLAGVSLNQNHFIETLGIISIPIYFLLGVMISAYLTEKNNKNKISSNKGYSQVMWLVTFCLALVVIGGQTKYFGHFGDPADLTHDYFLLALLCGSCGLQNAAISSSSDGTLRTTHLTGLTTDLGLGLIRALDKNLTSEKKKQIHRINLVRIGHIFSFTLGSFIGAYYYQKFQYLGFIFPLFISLLIALTTKDQKI